VGEKTTAMDGKHITFGTTGFDDLLEALREATDPQDITWLAERYIEILRTIAQSEKQE